MIQGADLAAEVAAEGKGQKTALWRSLHHLRIKSTRVRESKAACWLGTPMAAIKSQTPYHFTGKNGGHPDLARTHKLVASRFYQLSVGHVAMGAYLYGIGAVDTPECR